MNRPLLHRLPVVRRLGMGASLLLLAVLALGGCGDGSDQGSAVSSSTATPTIVAGTVQQMQGSEIVVTGEGGTQRLTVPPRALVDLLLEAQPTDVTAGDWLVVGGVPNPILAFAITGIVVIPADMMTEASDAVGSPAALHTRVAIPLFGPQGVLAGSALVGGQVERAEANILVLGGWGDVVRLRFASGEVAQPDQYAFGLAGWGSTLQIRLTAPTALRIARPGRLTDITSGSRVAILTREEKRGGNTVTVVQRLLVLPKPPQFPVGTPEGAPGTPTP